MDKDEIRDIIKNLYDNSSEEFKEECKKEYEDFFKNKKEFINNDRDFLIKLYKKSSKEVQEENFKELYSKILSWKRSGQPSESQLAVLLYMMTCTEVKDMQTENFLKDLFESGALYNSLLPLRICCEFGKTENNHCSEKVKEEIFRFIIDKSKDEDINKNVFNCDEITKLYKRSPGEIQKKVFVDVFDLLFSEKYNDYGNYYCYDNLRLEIFTDINRYSSVEAQTEIFNKVCTTLFNPEKKIDEDEKNFNIAKEIYLNSKSGMDGTNYISKMMEDNFQLAVETSKLRDWITVNENKVYKDEEIIKFIKDMPEYTGKLMLLSSKIDKEKIKDLNKIDEFKNENTNIDTIFSKIVKITDDGELDYKNINKALSEVYNLMCYNNVPDFIKSFRFFQLGSYYNNKNINLKSFEGKPLFERDKIIFADLFKIALDSNSKSLRQTCEVLIRGNEIKNKLQSDYFRKKEYDFKSLSDEDKAYLEQYADTLFELHNVFSDISGNGKEKVERTGNIIKDLKELKKQYPNQKGDNLFFDSNMIFREVFDKYMPEVNRDDSGKIINGKIGAKEILLSMNKRKNQMLERNKENYKSLMNGTLRLENGDIVKGIKDFPKYLNSILTEGIRAGEFNKTTAHSDATPFDADFSYIPQSNNDTTDYSIIKNTVAGGYGRTWIVIKEKNNERDDLLENLNNEFYDDSFSEIRCVRTGIGSEKIDYIVTEEWIPTFGYEMAMAGMYIPVKNTKDELVFSYEDYERIRAQMKGMRAYTSDPLEINSKVSNMEALFDIYRTIGVKSENNQYGKDSAEIEEDIREITQILEGGNDKITFEKKSAVLESLNNFFKQKKILVSNGISMDLTSKSVELIDTGSTGRGTNVPGDGDFDFMLRCNLSEEQKDDIGVYLNSLNPDEFTRVFDGYRAKNCKLKNKDGKEIEVDIDITIAPKSLNLEYSSDMCVKDRLDGIKELDEKNGTNNYKYVLANIIMAKKILKSIGLYKKCGSDGASIYGGFGGIGVENWVLQNGGSFIEAINTYMDATKNQNGEEVAYKSEDGKFDDFVVKYPIFDFGSNLREGKRAHDSYSSNLDGKEGFSYAKNMFGQIKEISEKHIGTTKNQEIFKGNQIQEDSTQSINSISKTINLNSAKKMNLKTQDLSSMNYILSSLLLNKNQVRCFEEPRR